MSAPRFRPRVNRPLVDVATRFWSKVDKTDRDGSGCWLWTGSKNERGYGSFNFASATRKAHRIAWLLTHTWFEPGKVLCHRCDRPSCVNPEHLFLGTPQENMADCSTKRRLNHQKDPSILKRGEAHHRAKMTTNKVIESRASFAAGESMQSLARRMGVSSQSISDIVHLRSWKEVGT